MDRAEPKLSVVITTSPVPCHPSTEMIDRCIASLREHLDVAFELVIACDGAREGNSHAEAYAGYKAALRDNRNAVVVEADEWRHHGPTAKAGVEAASAEFVLTTVHDFEMVRSVQVRPILETLATSRRVKYIRLNQRANIPIKWDFRMECIYREPVPLLATSCWAADPSFSRRDGWLGQVGKVCRKGRSTEEAVMGRPGKGWYLLARDGFQAFFKRWGACIYGGFGDPAMFHHLNGRTYTASEPCQGDSSN